MSQIDATIVFIRGNDLKIGDIATSDPFLTARLSGVFYNTKVIDRTLNPVWEETWKVKNFTLGSDLYIEVWDKDIIPPNDFLGSVHYRFDSSDLYNQELLFDVMQKDGSKKGTLTLRISTSLTLTVEKYPSSSSRAIKIHNSPVAGTATGSFRPDSSLPSFRAYSMEMFHVKTVFGDKVQKYNQNYKPAKMIFSNNPASNLLRKSIRTQHNALYREGHQRTETRQVLKADEFYSCFDYGYYNNVRKEYTYVLLDECFNFSETGAAFFADFMSKHAMHSKAARVVRYSGEFRLFPLPQGGCCLVIDNGSGTYAPDKNDLPLLKEVLIANFPDMVVETFDFRDPKLNDYKQKKE